MLEKGLSQEQADILIAQANAAAVDTEARVNARNVETLKARVDEWQVQIKADPELGGNNLSVTERNAQRVIDTFMPQKLRDELKSTGFGHYPEMVRFLNNIGKAMADDTPPSGGKPVVGKRDAASVLYGGS